MNQKTAAILKVLAYFDVFKHPLKASEVWLFLDSVDHDLESVESELERLSAEGVIFRFEDFYALQPDQSLIEKRKKWNKSAEETWPKAKKNAVKISRFPFVRGVMVSGSLSKNVIREDGDVDYFVVTAPNRLWIARTLLVAYKKVFLLNSRRFFCVNYFVDEENLLIPEQNVFTATEIVTVKPMVNGEIYRQFRNENMWANGYYPLMERAENPQILELKKRWPAKFVEWLCKGSLGEALDRRFMRITLKRWQRKFGFMSSDEFELTMRSTRRVSKHHPSNFQEKVVRAYHDKLEKIESIIQS